MEKTETSNTQTTTIPEQDKSNTASNIQLPLKKRKNKNRKLTGW